MKSLIEDYTDVFEENICNPDVPWSRCFENFADTVELIRKSPNKLSEKKVCRFLVWSSQLLEMKRISPKGIGVSCSNWRKDYSRKSVWGD